MNRQTLFQKSFIYIATAIGSLILTFINLAHNQPFNVDGVIYLNAAQEFLSHGIIASFAAYKWPFYSILIALTAKSTTLSVLNAAYLLDAVLYVAIAIFFVMLIKEFGGSKKQQWVGAFVIIFFPYLVMFGSHIMRDHGYFAFSLLAFIGLIKYCRTYQWRFAILWGVAMLIATLFRIEGAVLLCLLPLVLLFAPNLRFWQKLRILIRANLVLIIGSIGVFFYLLVLVHNKASTVSEGRIPELLFQVQHGLQTTYSMLLTKVSIIKTQVFALPSPYRGGEAVFLLGGLLAFYIGCVIATLGVLYTAIFLYVMLKKSMPYDWSAKAVWVWGIILNIIVTWLFLAQDFFLTTRYVGLLGLLLLITVPFGLVILFKNRWLFALIMLWLLAIIVGDVVHFGPSKAYIVEGGKWVAQNASKDSKIYSNDKQLYYYTQHQGLLDEDLLQFNKQIWRKYDYMVVKIRKDCRPTECSLESHVNLVPLKEFQNKRGDKVLIYKLK
jgi:hypothetical protein